LEASKAREWDLPDLLDPESEEKEETLRLREGLKNNNKELADEEIALAYLNTLSTNTICYSAKIKALGTSWLVKALANCRASHTFILE
jgi:hypothetical protein